MHDLMKKGNKLRDFTIDNDVQVPTQTKAKRTEKKNGILIPN